MVTIHYILGALAYSPKQLWNLVEDVRTGPQRKTTLSGQGNGRLVLTRQNTLYSDAIAEYGTAIQRLARAYEADPDKRGDLLQEIHLELWRSLADFDGRCSLRTWVYRVAHNVGATHIVRDRRRSARLVDLATLDTGQAGESWSMEDNRRFSAAMLLELIYRLRPLDRQVILLYLEGETAADIAETTGLSARNIATKIHRIKKLLKQQHTEGAPNATK